MGDMHFGFETRIARFLLFELLIIIFIHNFLQNF